MILKKYKQQKGQSLLYVAILIVVLVSGVFFVYDIGNIVNTKIKFQNGADAAALSAVAVKISKHHTDAMVRTSMFHESVAAQAQQRATQALLLKILLDVKNAQPVPGDISVPPVYTGPNPNQPGNIVQPPQMPGKDLKDDVKKYKILANLTYRHVIKLHRERKALEGYYQWLSADRTGLSPQAITEAARIGLRGNTFGLYSATNIGLAQNLKILGNPDELLENKRQFATPIGGVIYANEGSTIVGNFGKTFIEFDGKGVLSSQGTSLLNYFGRFNQYTLLTNAAARVSSSEELKTQKTPIGLFSGGGIFVPFEMLWYSPRLMSIEKKTDITIH
jgi:hypothetical protein